MVSHGVAAEYHLHHIQLRRAPVLESLDAVDWLKPEMPPAFRALLADADTARAEVRETIRAYVVEEYDCNGTVVAVQW
jgi:hypothetical protein